VQILGGRLRYFNEYGYAVDSVVDIDGEKFFFKGTGSLKKGLVVFEGKTYYFDKTKEHALTSQFVTEGNDTYYFGADGVALTGTHVIDGVTYTFNSDGKLVS
jgi:glucan-binding YG repeat protein